MIEAYRVADVRTLEDRARAGLPDGELMARASRGLAGVAGVRLEERHGRRVVALVGGGDNGADTLYAAGLLAEAGYAVAVVSVDRGGEDVATEAAIADGVVLLHHDDAWAEVLAEADVVLDGLTGIGGRPGLRPDVWPWVEAIPEDAWVIAVDLPSGADPAGEAVPDEDVAQGSTGPAHLVPADETVTFSLAKPVHLMPATEAAVGRLTVVDIGVDARGVTPAVERVTFDDVAALWPTPGASSDKYSRGVVGIVAGSVRYPGAAVLSVLGALGAGPGMVRYLGPRDVRWLVHQAAPEVVTAGGRVQAWVIGSGFDIDGVSGESREQRENAERALASDLPVLVDAGALALVDRRDAPTLLTPHAGELATLLTRLGAGPGGGEVSRQDVTRAPLAHARAAAERTGATLLLKGAHTLVVGPDPAAAIRSQADAPAWLATAGAGDVLGGLIGTLLAAGLSPLDAGSLGALVHGVAADRASGGGPLRVTEVAHGIPAVVASLLTRA